MIASIHIDQISDDALAALGDANLDDLHFGLDDRERVYCANRDERASWRWDREACRWVDFDWELFTALFAS